MDREPIIWVDGPTRRIALTLDQVDSRTDGADRRRGRRCQVSVRRSDAENGRWLFDVLSVGPRSGGPYRVRARISPHTRNPDSSRLSEKDVELSCSCPAWRFNGPDYWSGVMRYLWRPTDSIPNLFPGWPKPGRSYSDGSFPEIRDPNGRHGACKHVAAVLRIIKDYWAPPGGQGRPFQPQVPGVTPRAFWGKLGVPDIRAYLEEQYEGRFTDTQLAEATVEALNEWYDEPGLFERARSSIRPAEDVMFDDVLREIGRSGRKKEKFLELFEEEVSAGRELVEHEEAEDEEVEPEEG